MTALKVTSLLDGVPRLKRAIQLADPATRERTRLAIKRGAERIVAEARSRAPKDTGEMAATIRAEYNDTGLIAYVKVGLGKLPRRSHASRESRQLRLARRRKAAGTRAGKGAYAPVVERGDPKRHHKPHPFLIPALLTNRDAIAKEIGAAAVEGPKSVGLGE